MNKKAQKTQFFCQECGATHPKWQGQCTHCGAWNSIIEATPFAGPVGSFTEQNKAQQVVSKPSALNAKTLGSQKRYSTRIQEADRVLGGGLLAGSYILLGGEPGIGKSTLLLHISYGLSQEGLKTLYISAEESEQQTRLRAERMNIKNSPNIFLLNESILENIFHHAKKLKPDVLIIDSIQTMRLSMLPSAPGTISQVRECASELMRFAKNTNIAIFVVGHITKEGQVAGPKLLEHLVDTVLTFEGDPHYPFRLLKAQKNRFGPAQEMGVFQMSAQGLKEVTNPSEFFLEERKGELTGAVVFTAMEGSRPLLCEVQALTLRSYLNIPRRNSIGLDINRLHKITAVLDRYLKTGLSQCDIFLNLAGGLKISEPGVDMAIAKALLSAKKQEPVDRMSCFFGEIGLTGELRACVFPEQRIQSAQQLGFKNIYLPAGNKKHISKKYKDQMGLHWVSTIKDLA